MTLMGCVNTIFLFDIALVKEFYEKSFEGYY
jgi:hypothetical protein